MAVQPGSHGQVVIAAIGWHGPGNTAYNGFYESTDSGRSFREVTPAGDVNAGDIGRTTFAYSADGSKLWLSGRYNSDVYEISTRTGRLLRRIPVGSGPHGLCVWPQPGRYSIGHTGILR